MSHGNHQQIIAALNNCAAECNHCANACLDEQDVKMLAKCIKLDIDCVEICSTTASLLARDSAHGHHLLKECVEVCNACAEECEKHSAMGMEHCKTCADACRTCADACSKHLNT
ncbi:MAG: four-helix bundle copper-binding protein [Chitinophagaceae bacterium]|nr:four-helix bundle copper-binding protein [Chitinophagaceae bacterium]